MRNVEEFLKSLIIPGTSDIHFKVGRPPLLRIYGSLKPAEKSPALTRNDTEELAMHFLGGKAWEKFQEHSEVDTAYSVPGFSRFRLSVFRQRGSVSIVMRIIPFSVPTLDGLRIPSVVRKIALSPRGLILVTGVTGSGKSSTLAAIVNHINENSPVHIITIEDPIEFLHQDKKASINQREIGTDTREFATAFRAALRQDPDVILIGELRDAETMEIALRAAETGHLVISTVHTTDAKETVGRFVDMFPSHQQRQIRIQLAANLRAVISQRLLDSAGGKGRVLAAEVLIVTAAIRDCILQPEKTGEIVDYMAKGKDQYGMQTFDQAIMELLSQNLVSEDEAIKNATSPNDFRLRMSLGRR